MTKPLGQVGLTISSVILTIATLLFLLLLFVSYFSKKGKNSIRIKLYKIMLIVDLVLVVSEIVATLFAAYNFSPLLVVIMFKLHWSTGIICFSLLYFYSVTFISEVEVDSIFDLFTYNKSNKIISIIFFISYVVYLVIPFDINYLTPPYISYIPGIPAYYVLTFCAISTLMIFVYFSRKGKDAPQRKKNAVILLIVELLILFILQVIYRNIAFLGLGSALQMFFLYFNIENPDLYVIGELEKVKSDIEKSNRAKSDFLSNMSHEIRTPMNAIIGFGETLLTMDDFDENKAREDIKHIESAGNNLLDIVNNILDISKIESGKDTIDLKEYSISGIVKELTSIIESRLSNKNVKLIVEIDKNIPSKLIGDSTKLFQILLNLLTNSVKYTEAGHIKLSIVGEKNGNYEKLHIKVIDTGYGIKEEDHDKVFEKFSRLENATENEIEGTGLGLVITKKFVELMGGRIWFESEYNVGTTFYVDLNQKISNNQSIGEINDNVSKKESEELLDCSNYKVLLVDDNELNLKVASRLLSKYHFKIETVNNARDCIYKIKAENHYDIIFLDHMMPEMDGIQTLHVLKKLDGYTLPPIVALTANAITGMREMYLNEGFDEYLSKPINVIELNKIITKYFEK